MTKFQDLGLNDEVLKGISEQGFEEAFPIQEAVIPVLLSGRDVVGQAHTGSGKTAAFALSMLQEIQPKQGIQGLIMAPTRELAMQISDEIKKFGKYTGIKNSYSLWRTRHGNSIRYTSQRSRNCGSNSR